MEQLITTTVSEPRRPVDSLVRVVGHIVEALRPDGFPQEVYIDHIVRDFTPEQIVDLVNTTIKGVFKDGAMAVSQQPKDEDQSGQPSVNKRMIVPLHMISHITADTLRMTEPMPNLQEQNRGLLQ